jgi:hypothetical protein
VSKLTDKCEYCWGDKPDRVCPCCECSLHEDCTEWHGCDPCGRDVCSECISKHRTAVDDYILVCRSCREPE